MRLSFRKATVPIETAAMTTPAIPTYNGALMLSSTAGDAWGVGVGVSTRGVFVGAGVGVVEIGVGVADGFGEKAVVGLWVGAGD